MSSGEQKMQGLIALLMVRMILQNPAKQVAPVSVTIATSLLLLFAGHGETSRGAVAARRSALELERRRRLLMRSGRSRIVLAAFACCTHASCWAKLSAQHKGAGRIS